MPPAADPGTWATLPAATRAEALRLAEHGKAHSDPAIVAAIITAARYDRAYRHQTERIVGRIGITLFTSSWLAMYYYGGFEVTGRAWLPVMTTLLGFGLITAATRQLHLQLPLDRLLIGVPAHAEVTNLRAILQHTPTPPTAPLTVRRTWLVTLTGVTLFALATAVIVPAMIAWLELPTPPNAGDLPRSILTEPLLPAAAALVWAVMLPLRRRPFLRLSEAGIHTLYGKPTPWTDITGLYLKGPRPNAPTADLQIEYEQRDGRRVAIDLDGLDHTPEQIVLAARAYHTRQTAQPMSASSRTA
ncbi:hypothetical protein HDA40_000263 [Hamadaea flava]|uniref:PH domain-containing protein n=1 Tax=Hamadaea flava TaxID=1742688 RepID=A0ABV8LTM8_9ACTN|nr:hypothetical protein [Hamadaea flava]MCP2321756.1 hypothetical protein [Hamadaea flava]